MIIYVATLTAGLCTLMLALVYLADLWEREPLELIQNAFLAGLGVQLVLVLGGHRLAGVEAWSGWLYLLTLAALSVVLPVLLVAEAEVDERFDGVVYAVAFTVGAAGTAHLFNLPGAAARHPESVILGGGETPGVRDLLLLITAPGPRGELADLLALLASSALAGAVFGTLRLHRRRLPHQIGGMLLAALAAGGVDLAAGGAWPIRAALAAAAVAATVALKGTSIFRRRPSPPEREVFLGALKSVLLVFGSIVMALALIMGLTDSWRTTIPETPGIEQGSGRP